MFKKKSIAVTAVLLSLVLLLSQFGISTFARENSLSAIVATDLHYTAKSIVQNIQNYVTMPENPLFSHARHNAQLFAESEAIINSFLDIAAQSESRCILISGDLADFGRPESHRQLALMFKKFEEETQKQIYVINGNHDAKEGFTKANFAENYYEFGYSQALVRDENSLSYTADLDDKYRLIAIDSCIYDESYGEINSSLLLWIENQAKDAKKDNKNLIAIMHHNLLKHMNGLAVYATDKLIDDRLENADDVWELFANWGIKYIFTGHAHSNDIASSVSQKGNEIFDVETCALIGHPCSYRNVEFSDTGVKITTNDINEIEINQLPLGYSQEQLRLIASDFNGYAYGMMVASTKYMLRSYMANPLHGIEKLRLDPESSLAQLLIKIMPRMHETLCLPLYKTEATNGNSIEEVAEKCGYQLPASNYSDLFEIAGKVVGEKTRGDENLPADSIEIRLLWDCIKVAAVDSLDTLEEDIEKAIIESNLPITFSNIKSFATLLAFRQSIVRKIMTVLLGPAIEGVTVDSEPGDLNVILAPYSQAGTSESIIDAIQKFLAFVFDYITKLIKVFM